MFHENLERFLTCSLEIAKERRRAIRLAEDRADRLVEACRILSGRVPSSTHMCIDGLGTIVLSTDNLNLDHALASQFNLSKRTGGWYWPKLEVMVRFVKILPDRS